MIISTRLELTALLTVVAVASLGATPMRSGVPIMRFAVPEDAWQTTCD